jgi:hypothetical protein
MATKDLGLGTDWAIENDLEERIRLVTGHENLSLAVVRRLSTPRGGLFYDPDYGLDLRLWLSSDFSLSDIQTMAAQIEDEVGKDERIQSVRATISYDLGTERMDVVLDLVDEVGPFQLVLGISEVTVAILRGGTTQTTAAPTAAAAAPVIVEAASGGARGPSGPPGASGGAASFELAYDDDGEHLIEGTTETTIVSWLVNFAGAPGTLTAALAASAKIGTLTGTIRLRVGGTENGIDGTVIATTTVTATAFTAKFVNGGFANPTGQAWVKVTAAAGGASDQVYVRRPAVVISE